jgi:predicted tellurium resistance membrane protein TerC
VFEFVNDPNAWATFALLIGLELVLGIDNVLLISILADRLPKEQRLQARIIGLSLALVVRIAMLFGVTWLQEMKEPVLWKLSWRDIILLAGGLFLIYKAVKEIHHVVERADELHEMSGTAPRHPSFSNIILQIVLMDIVFSLDSVITAVGLTHHLVIIIAAVILSFVGILFFAGTVADFVQSHPALKILALAFLVTIGVTLVMEGFHQEVPKAYIYLPMGFALAIELLQMRYDYTHKRGKHRAKDAAPPP